MGDQPDFQLHRGRGELSLQQYPAQVWGQFEVGGSDDGFGVGVDSDALKIGYYEIGMPENHVL
jgi:hypothetical protein